MQNQWADNFLATNGYLGNVLLINPLFGKLMIIINSHTYTYIYIYCKCQNFCRSNFCIKFSQTHNFAFCVNCENITTSKILMFTVYICMYVCMFILYGVN